jgi:hypothetical protein
MTRKEGLGEEMEIGTLQFARFTPFGERVLTQQSEVAARVW